MQSALSRIRRLLFAFVVFFCPSFVVAETSAHPSVPEKLDVVLLFDASASMRMTDPLRLRDQGGALFLQFLRQGDRLAIIEFSDQPHTLLPFAEVDPKDMKRFNEILTKVGNSGIYTDLSAGISGAAKLLKESARTDATQLIILLSDGKMDPAPASGLSADVTKKLLGEALPELRSKNIKIHTLAFSEEADRDLLSQIALGTDGVSWFTPDAEKVHQSFADLFLVVKKPQMVPVTKRGLSIDEEVNEATFYINRAEGSSISIITPAGKQISATSKPEEVRWYEGKQFDVITIIAPETGVWQIIGAGTDEAFATVLTNLRLLTDWPANIYAGDENVIEARLYEGEKPVSLEKIGGVTTFGFQITPTDRVTEPIVKELLTDDGKNGDHESSDGAFSRKVTLAEPGEYRLQVRAKGPTFSREQNIPFRVRPPLLSVRLGKSKSLSESHGEGEHGHEAEGHGGGDPVPVFQVQLSADAQALKSVEIELHAETEEHEEYDLPLTRSKADPLLYESAISNLPHSGKFEIQADIRAKTKRGGNTEATSRVLEYEFSDHTEVGSTTKKEAPKKEEPVSIVFPLLTLIVVNLIVGAAGFFLVKQKEDSSAEVPEYNVPPEIEGLRTQFRERAQLADVDLADPRLTAEDTSSHQTGAA